MIVLDGTSLTCAEVAAIGRRAAGVEIGESGQDRASLGAQVSRAVSAGRDIYGRSSGVGANRSLRVDDADGEAHGLRLLRSHAGDAGPLLEPELGLALLAVRANQIAAGGSGVDPGVLAVLADCVNRGLRPPARVYGAIGTGDLAALAVTALCLLGERDWLADPAGRFDPDEPQPVTSPPRFALPPTDALPFISSNAATIAEAAIGCHDLSALLAAGQVIAALSHQVAGASAEPYAEAVQLARPHPGQQQVAAALRDLLADEPTRTARNQHPYGFRVLPQVHGAAVDALAAAERVVTRELNAAAENPLVDAYGKRFFHNGNFHTAYLALALDGARAAVFQAAALSAARLGALMDPSITGLAGFLAADPVPSSGLMITEYVAQSALAEIRLLAAPAALGSAVVSLGAEEHAGFGTQAARATTRVVHAYRVALACELVASVRGLRQLGIRRPAGRSAWHSTSLPLRYRIRWPTGRWNRTSPLRRNCYPTSRCSSPYPGAGRRCRARCAVGQVVVVGSINADYVVRIGHLPRPGETVAGGVLDIQPGGKGANQAHAAARLGVSVVMIGAVGTDAAGDGERAALQLAGVDVSALMQCRGPSGIAMILVDDAGENMIAVAPGANGQLSAEAVIAGLAGRLDSRPALLASLEVPLEAVAAAARTAGSAGATVIINPAPGMQIPPDLLTDAVLTPNEGELRLLAPDSGSEDEAIAAVLSAGARAVVVTRGASGASLYEPGQPECRVPAPQVAVVDTVEPGDAFNGALAAALSEGEDLLPSVRWAVAAGAAACTGPGARGALPTRADVEALTRR